MALPTDLSPNLSIVTQRVHTPVEGSQVQAAPSPRVPSSPAHRMTSDVLASASAFAPVSEGLSFVPLRSPTSLAEEPAGSPVLQRARTPELTETSRVEVVAPSSPEEAPNVFNTVCNRISTAVTEFVNWIASIVYPSSVEDVSGQVSVAVVQTQVQEESLSADAKKAAKDTEEEAPSMFTTVCGRISNFITAVGEWITSFFVSTEAPVISESDSRLDAAIQENEAAMSAAINAVTAARVAREAAAAAAGVVQTTMANVESLLGETADQSDSKVAPQSTQEAIEGAVVEDSSIVIPQGESDTEALA